MESSSPDAATLERYRATLCAQQALTADDLTALRAGRACPASLRAVRRAMTAQVALLAVGPLVAAMGLGFSAVLVRAEPAAAFELAGVAFAWPALFVLVGALVSVLGCVGLLGLRAERRASIVVLEGPTQRGVLRKQRQYLDVGSVRFVDPGQPVLAAVFPVLVAPWPLRVFLTARRRLIVGVEPLPAPPAAAAPLAG